MVQNNKMVVWVAQLNGKKMIKSNYYNCVLIAVAHDEFKKLLIEQYMVSKNRLVYDLKNIFKNKEYMRL